MQEVTVRYGETHKQPRNGDTHSGFTNIHDTVTIILVRNTVTFLLFTNFSQQWNPDVVRPAWCFFSPSQKIRQLFLTFSFPSSYTNHDQQQAFHPHLFPSSVTYRIDFCPLTISIVFYLFLGPHLSSPCVIKVSPLFTSSLQLTPLPEFTFIPHFPLGQRALTRGLSSVPRFPIGSKKKFKTTITATIDEGIPLAPSSSNFRYRKSKHPRPRTSATKQHVNKTDCLPLPLSSPSSLPSAP